MRGLLSLIFCCFSFLLQAQEALQGTVYDAADSTALANVSIYFDGTTVGTITKGDGSYILPDNYATKANVVISFLGYGTLTVPAEQLRGRKAKIYLAQSTESLNEVVFDDDPWSREKKLAEFKREFLGQSEEANHCRIKNEKALRLRFSPSDQKLYADSVEPIIVTNRHLGYEVTYELSDFFVRYNRFTGSFLPELVYYEGISRFRELRAKPRKRFLKNRKSAYDGSLIHFNRSLVKKKLTENDFRIFYKRQEVGPYTYFEMEEVESGMSVDVAVPELTILCDKNYQSQYMVNSPFVIDALGNHYPPAALTVSGAMGRRRIAAMLPLDYGLSVKEE
ncbi:MAG: carboxypeptidase-like regulatory domain-containing protein [Leeuwenhoekiella sp.]